MTQKIYTEAGSINCTCCPDIASCRNIRDQKEVWNEEDVRSAALDAAADANNGYIDAKTKRIVNAALNVVFFSIGRTE